MDPISIIYIAYIAFYLTLIGIIAYKLYKIFIEPCKDTENDPICYLTGKPGLIEGIYNDVKNFFNSILPDF